MIQEEKNHILIVDDNLKNLQVTANTLKAHGYLISMAQNGTKALEMATVETPHLILLDVMMPGINGFETCKKLKMINQLMDIPVIFLTAKDQTEDQVNGFNAGGVDYITKPFNSTELLARVRTHIELAHSRNKIIELNRNRDKLYSIIAHDIKGPMANINFMMETLAYGAIKPGDEAFDDVLHQLAHSSKETMLLLENLLLWTRSQGAQIQPTIESIKPAEITSQLVELYKRSADKKEIKIINKIQDVFELNSDKNMIHTILRNLVSNAIKFTPKKGNITISADQNGQEINFHVQDTGMGISEEAAKNILIKDNYYTSEGTEYESGTGLGLKLVAEFVEILKGNISFRNAPEGGAIFTVSLNTNSN